MKGIIVEIHQNMAALLSDDGMVRRVTNLDYFIGQEVEVSMKKKMNWKKWMAISSAAACLIFALGIGTYAYTTPYSKVSLDVNPSIEYTLNRFGRVIDVEGKNKDGNAIISEATKKELLNHSIQDAVAETVDVIAKNGYFDNEDAEIVIATSSDNKDVAKELATKLKTVAEGELKQVEAKATVESTSVGKALVEEAKKLGVTPGKLNLVQNLIKVSGEESQIQQKEWLNKSVKEIIAETKAQKSQIQNNEDMKLENQEQNKEENKEENKTQDSVTEPQNPAQNSEQNGGQNANPAGKSEGNTGEKKPEQSGTKNTQPSNENKTGETVTTPEQQSNKTKAGESTAPSQQQPANGNAAGGSKQDGQTSPGKGGRP